MSKTRYFDWQKVLSYNADVSMVSAIRGKGKTYGIRKQCVKWFIDTGERFCEVSRYEDESKKISKDYFGKLELNNEFPGYIFRTNNTEMWIAKRPENEKEKPEWHLMGYFVAMTKAGAAKQTTFVHVRNIILDEAIIDKRISPYSRYLPNEFSTFANVVDSLTRENPNDENYKKPRIFLLCNACDLVNPYFRAFGIKHVPNEGFSWYKDKTFLLYYSTNDEVAKEKLANTVSGRMIAGTDAADVAAYNMFPNAHDEFIGKKTPKAKFYFGFKFNNETFGAWLDYDIGLFFINKKIPSNTTKPIYALSTDDNGIDYVMAKRSEPTMKMLAELYYKGCIRYDTPYVRERFVFIMSMFGVR